MKIFQKTIWMGGGNWRSLLESLAVESVFLTLMDFQSAGISENIIWSGIFLAGTLAAGWMAFRKKPSKKPWMRQLFGEGWPAIVLPAGLIGIQAILRLWGNTINVFALSGEDYNYFALLISSSIAYVGIRLIALAWHWLNGQAARHLQWGIVRTIVASVATITAVLMLILVCLFALNPNLYGIEDNVATSAFIMSVLLRSLVPWLFIDLVVTGGAVLFILGPSVLISYRVSRLLNQRLQTLTKAARDLRAGKLDARVPSVGHDEIAQLQDDFNSMADHIQRTNQTLSESRDQIAVLLENQRQLTALVSHELRTPVTTLRGYLEKSLDSIEEVPVGLSNDLEIMHHEVLRLQSLIDDLFTLSRIDLQQLDLQIDCFNVCVLVEQIVNTIKSGAWKNGRVEVVAQLPRGATSVLADEKRLEQIILNLLNNAIHHTGPGGMIIVAVEPLNGWVEITVADTGEGIAPEMLPKVWERFNHGSESGMGSGLGLALVKDLTERMNGQVGVESKLDEGSRFWVRLPAC